MKNGLAAVVATGLALYAVGTVAAHVTGMQDTPYPLAPCEHVIMMSAPMDDGSILAYCEGSEFFSFDYDGDQRWHHMTLVPIRGAGIMPVQDEHVLALQRHAELIGDQRAVGVYE